MRVFRLILLLALCAVAAAGVKAWHDTMADPVVRRAIITSAQLPPGTPPVTLLLLSDIHVAGPDMPPSRLARIVSQANALEPDIVLVAGDLVSDKAFATHIYSTQETIAPLAKLAPRLAKLAVAGNHDHWRGADEVTERLRQAGFTVLANDAVQVGPLAIGGEDDDFTRHADIGATMRAFAPLAGPRILFSHSPEHDQRFPPEIALVLAGHTHCGQILYPWGGSPSSTFGYGSSKFACGLQRLNGTLRVTTAGLGTSVLPVRFLAVPDMWLITIQPAAAGASGKR